DDRRPLADRLRMLPRLECVAHGVHVAVGADARILEQLPGAAHARLGLENGEGLARQPGPQVARCADAGEPGTDNNDVKPLVGHFGVLPSDAKIFARQQANIRRKVNWRATQGGMLQADPALRDASSIWMFPAPAEYPIVAADLPRTAIAARMVLA